MSDFSFAAPRPQEMPPERKRKRRLPPPAAVVLALLAVGCGLCGVIAPGDPGHMDLAHCGVPPCGEFWFGTDAMGRDLFAMIWHGGRTSLLVGFGAAGVSAGIAAAAGSLCGLAPRWLEALLDRLMEILLSVPALLLTVLLQAILGKATAASLIVVIGATGWTPMARVVAGEVRRLRACDYVAASRAMGGGFFHILRRHLAPNFLTAMLPMAVMNVGGAIASEATLSFMGIGLPVEEVSWGSMLSLSEQALLGGQWWMIVIPGGFLIAALLSVTSLGNRLRKDSGRRHSNL